MRIRKGGVSGWLCVVCSTGTERYDGRVPFETDTMLKTELPSNGLAFSCRARAADYLQKAHDLVREAISCNAVFGRITARCSVVLISSAQQDFGVFVVALALFQYFEIADSEG